MNEILTMHIRLWQVKLKKLKEFAELYFKWCREFDRNVELQISKSDEDCDR